LLVNGAAIGSWTADGDDDEWHDFISEPLELAEGDTIAVHGTAGGGEYARVQSVTLRSRNSEAGYEEVALGEGRVLQMAGSLEALSADECAVALEALRAETPVSGAWPETVLVNVLRQPERGIISAHIVNHDFVYDDAYAIEEIRPTPEITLQVSDPALTVAWLVAPGAEPVELPVVEGAVTVPPVEVYAALLLAADTATLEALETAQ